MTAKPSLPEAIRQIRKVRGLSQEAFSNVSSRTYLSSLERGLKSPTMNKLIELCEVLEVHPLALMTLAYLEEDSLSEIDTLLASIRAQVLPLLKEAQRV
ncbi:TPA: helix-turn-helix domain-containing protein [Pseudomonas aeruginosa]